MRRGYTPFFAAKNGVNSYHGHVADWLDNYMEQVLLGNSHFDYVQEEVIFRNVFSAIESVLGENAFCKIKDDRPIGGLAPAHYEAIAVAFSIELDRVKSADRIDLGRSLIAARQSTDFRSNVGAGANNRTKLRGRISAITAAIQVA